MRSAKFLVLALASIVSALPAVTLPWLGQVSLDGLVGHLSHTNGGTECNRTIYRVLKDDKQYSRLVKALDLSESVVELLSDQSKSITFFALPDCNLPDKPHWPHGPHHGDHSHCHDGDLVSLLTDDSGEISYDLGHLVQLAEELEEEPETCDKEKHKEILAHIIHKIAAYHVLPKSYGIADLIQRSTYATNLTLDDGSMDSQPQRLSVVNTLIPSRIRINTFVEVINGDIKAKNGIIHQIDRALLPPLPVFQEAFLVPEVFSTYTSAIQRVDLASAIDRWECSWDDDEWEVECEGAKATTAFALSSDAFERLPKSLKMYLFSPFGQRALKKLLAYHIIPNFILHTDYIHSATPDELAFGRYIEHAPQTRLAAPVSTLLEHEEYAAFCENIGCILELVYEYSASLPTLLSDHHAHVHVARYGVKLPLPGFPRYYTTLKVNGQSVGTFDIPARNGALHVLSTVLDPRQGRDRKLDGGADVETTWEDWEKWLPKWAMEN